MSVVTPVTQRHVATACGLHPSTVCLALKNSPSIPPETRRRIQAIADKLGYSPNVAARNLALLRTEKKSGAHLPIAWINQESSRDYWRSCPDAQVFLEAARRRAVELGYHLEEVWTQEPGMTPARIVHILQTRGIDGVIFATHRGFDFSLLERTRAWEEFALVGINDQRLGEWVDVVCPDFYRNMDVALRRVRQVGFVNPGLVVTAQCDSASNGVMRGCYALHQSETAQGSRTPVCFSSLERSECVGAILEWVGEHRPDVVLCADSALLPAVREACDDIPVVQVGGVRAVGACGVDICAAEVASIAVESVVEKIRRFEKGFREATRALSVKGVWHDGLLATRELVSVVA